jgi:hypothetical protein
MNVDQDIKKFFKPMKKNITTHVKSKTTTSTNLAVQHDTNKIDNLEYSLAHNDNASRILKNKRNSTITFKVNIIIDKKSI